jgi:hypothetical protein
MGRKSNLTEKQWAEIERRLTEGEAGRQLAKEFGISEAAIRKRCGAQSKQVKVVANQLVAAELALRALPIGAQISARSLADKLKSISDHMAGAAEFGAMTAHRLAGIANSQVERIDDADPLKTANELASISLLMKVANQSAEIGIGILKANKDAKPEDDEPTPVAVNFGVRDAKRRADS